MLMLRFPGGGFFLNLQIGFQSKIFFLDHKKNSSVYKTTYLSVELNTEHT